MNTKTVNDIDELAEEQEKLEKLKKIGRIVTSIQVQMDHLDPEEIEDRELHNLSFPTLGTTEEIAELLEAKLEDLREESK